MASMMRVVAPKKEFIGPSGETIATAIMNLPNSPSPTTPRTVSAGMLEVTKSCQGMNEPKPEMAMTEPTGREQRHRDDHAELPPIEPFSSLFRLLRNGVEPGVEERRHHQNRKRPSTDCWHYSVGVNTGMMCDGEPLMKDRRIVRPMPPRSSLGQEALQPGGAGAPLVKFR